jgi:hypothetical protein
MKIVAQTLDVARSNVAARLKVGAHGGDLRTVTATPS